jgi:hypothetical protein
MIYIIITTCIIDKYYDLRKNEYIEAINKIKVATADIPCKLCIVEGNGKRKTFLDDLGIEVLYTNNNLIEYRFDTTYKRPNFYEHYLNPITSHLPNTHSNKGRNELLDIWDCIKHLNVQDDDFVIKLTGRYYITDTNEILSRWKIFDTIDSMYYIPPYIAKGECLTGMIGLQCKYIKEISLPYEESVENRWGEVCFSVPRPLKLNRLGIYGSMDNRLPFNY